MSDEIPGYDNWKLAERPYLRDERAIIGECCECGCDVYENEGYDVYGDIVCEEHDLNYMRKFKKVGA